MEKIKIQISPKRIIKDAMTVWNEPGPEVDVVMEPKNLTFRPGSVEAIYSFHVLDHLFPSEIKQALNNWHGLLGPGGKLFALVDDFEYICRGFVGGDVDIETINAIHNHPSQFTRDHLIAQLKYTGFGEDKQIIWFEAPAFMPKAHYELLIEATKS